MFLTEREIIIRLLFAAAAGAAVGLERDLKRKPAGIRTTLFICMGSALFTILSGELGRAFGETGGTRIASNIVQGVGFLGAGAILRDRSNVAGLTSAASIWAMAAVGMTIGGGFFRIAIFVVVLLLFALVGIGWLEDRSNLKSRMRLFRITVEDAKDVLPQLQQLLKECKVKVTHFQTTRAKGEVVVEFDADVSYYQEQHILQEFSKLELRSEVMPLDAHKD